MAPKASRADVKDKGKGKMVHPASKASVPWAPRRSSRFQIAEEHRIRPARHIEKGDARPLLIRSSQLSKSLLARRKLVLEQEECGRISGVERGKEKVEVVKSLAPETASRDLSLMERLQKQLAAEVSPGGSNEVVGISGVEASRDEAEEDVGGGVAAGGINEVGCISGDEASGDEAEEDIGDIREPSRSNKKSRLVIHRIPKLVADEEVSEQRFFDEKARQNYLSFETRNVDLDKGFSVKDYNHSCLYQILEERSWQEFLKHPINPASWELIREFYANAGRSGEGYSWVRGVRVSFKASAIAKAFKMKAAPHLPGFFSPVISHKSTLKRRVELAEFACRYAAGLGGGWASDAEVVWTNKWKTSFNITGMSPVVRVWWIFYCSKVKPTCRVSRVSIKDMYAVYCMMKNCPINVGELIEADISNRATHVSMNFGHPHLIVLLCKQSGVDLTKFKKDVEFGRPIAVPHGMPRKAGPVKTSISSLPAAAADLPLSEDEHDDYQTSDSSDGNERTSSRKDASSRMLLRKIHEQGKLIQEQAIALEVQKRMLEFLDSKMDAQSARMDAQISKMDAQAEDLNRFQSLVAQRLGMLFPNVVPAEKPPAESSRPKKRGR